MLRPLRRLERVRRPWVSRALELALVLGLFLGIRAWQLRGVAEGNAPALTGRTLDGRELSLEALRAQGPVLVHFFATWCTVCAAEEGSIGALAQDHRVLTVAAASGDTARVKAWAAGRGFAAPILVDESGALAQAWGVRAFPTSFVIARDGTISAHEVGFTTGWGLRLRLWLAGRG